MLLLAQCQLLLRSSLSVPTSVSVGGRWQWPPCAVNAPPSPQDHQSLLELSPLHSFHVTRPSCPSFSPPLGHVPCLRVSVHVCDARHVRWPCGVKGVRLKVGVEGVRGVRGVCCLVSMVSMAIGATTLICHALMSVVSMVSMAHTHSCIHSAYTHSCMSCLWCPCLVSIVVPISHSCMSCL